MEKKCARRAPAGAGSRTWDLLHAKRGSVAARYVVCFDTYAFPFRMAGAVVQHHALHVLEIVSVRFCKIW